MPRADRKLIDAAIRRARWGGLIDTLRRYWLPLVLVAGMIAVFVFSTSSPPRHVAYVGGEVVRVHRPPSQAGAMTRAATIRLDDGGEVPVLIPATSADALHRRVVIEVLRHDRPPRVTTYRFDHYEDGPPAE